MGEEDEGQDRKGGWVQQPVPGVVVEDDPASVVWKNGRGLITWPRNGSDDLSDRHRSPMVAAMQAPGDHLAKRLSKAAFKPAERGNPLAVPPLKFINLYDRFTCGFEVLISQK